MLFVAVFSAIVGGVHYYLWVRLIRSPDLGPSWHRAGTWALIAAGALIPIGLFANWLYDLTIRYTPAGGLPS